MQGGRVGIGVKSDGVGRPGLSGRSHNEARRLYVILGSSGREACVGAEKIAASYMASAHASTRTSMLYTRRPRHGITFSHRLAQVGT